MALSTAERMLTVKSTAVPLVKAPLTYAREIVKYEGLSPVTLDDDEAHVGVDVGTRNMGLALIVAGRYAAWQITLDDYPNYAWGLAAVEQLLHYLLNPPKIKLFDRPGRAVIEMAAISKGHSSTSLGMESVRAVCAVMLGHNLWEVEAQRPNQIYRRLWGNGKVKTSAIWGINMGHDAAEALGCAVLAQNWERLK